ncbi:MAG: hypothetical protein ACRDST_12915 [Pseudonocardiaceae bacterium]
MEHILAGIVGVHIGFGEQLLLTDEYLVPDPVVAGRLIRSCHQPAGQQASWRPESPHAAPSGRRSICSSGCTVLSAEQARLPAPATSHTCLNLGEEEYTKRRPHPMIDPQARIELLRERTPPWTSR